MTRYKNHHLLKTQPNRKRDIMFNRPSAAEKRAQIEAYNSGQINLQVAEAARLANETRLAREREQYAAEEKRRLAQREIDRANSQFQADVELEILAAKNRLAGAITHHDISAAKTAAGELVILERIFK